MLKNLFELRNSRKISIAAIIISVLFSEIIVIGSDLLFNQEIMIRSVVRGFTIPLIISTSLAIIGLRFVDRLVQTETALRKSEAENRAILEALPDTMFQLSLDGRFLQYHTSRPEISWRPPEASLGKSVYEIFPKANADLVTSFIAKTVRTGEVQRYEYQLPYEGAEHHYEARMVLLQEDRVLTIVRDITAQKKAEMTLHIERTSLTRRVEERTTALHEANVQLLHALRTQDEFLANVSHELRTPLTAILAFTDLLQRELYGPLNTKQLRTLTLIKDSGQHLLELINNILDISKIEAGQLTLNIGPTNVESICRASLQLIEPIARNKQLHVTSHLDAAVSSIDADGLRLKQILVNLLNNAVKFTPQDGALGLEMNGNASTGMVHFTVWDTGIGIAKEDISRIFQPFVQLDPSLTREYEGSGLGLALVSHLTEMHGGTIAVESTVGEGSRFTVSLPWHTLVPSKQEKKVTPQPPSEEPPEVTPTKPIDSPVILIAEDNATNRKVICDLLAYEGYRTIEVQDGTTAITTARQRHPDLILMDIQMPGMDGLEATRRIRADADLQSIPIVAVTALAMPGDRERCLDAGANAYLSKPIDAQNLLDTIERILKQPPKSNL